MRETKALVRQPGEIPSFLIKDFAIVVIPRTTTTKSETEISLPCQISEALNNVTLDRNIWHISFIIPIYEFIY